MTTTINGLKINYKTKGQGKRIFLLHGWGANIELFNNLIDVLSVKYEAIAIDLPGFGLSEEPKEAWSVLDYTNFVIDFIKKTFADTTDAIFLGHSYGGRIIIKMTSSDHLPFKIEKIILVDAAGIKPRRSIFYYVKVYSYKVLKHLVDNKFVKKLYPELKESLVKIFGSSDYSNASGVMRKSMSLAVNEDLTPLLSKIEIDTLLIWGEKDTATPISDGELMNNHIKNSGLVRIKNAGHYSFLDDAFTFNRVIKSFLSIGE